MSEPTINLKRYLMNAASIAEEAKRRVWAARDRVLAGRTQLILDENELAAAERDYDEVRAVLADAWDLFRAEMTKPATEEATGSDPAVHQSATVPPRCAQGRRHHERAGNRTVRHLRARTVSP